MSNKEERRTLITQLTAFLKGSGSEEIDRIVTEVKEQANTERIEECRSVLENLIDSQMATIETMLASMQIPSEAIIKIFQDKRNETLNKAVEMEIPAGNLPILSVIPRSYLGTCGLMAMIRNGEKIGRSYLNPNKITDNEDIPDEPYFALDIENGKATLGESPKDAEKIIKSQDRLCHILDEDIAVCIHTDVLLDRCLWSTGSRYWSTDRVLGVYLDGNAPRISYGSVDDSLYGRGSASCRSRV